MVRAGWASMICAPAPRPFTQAASRWQNHRSAPPTPRSFTLSTRRRKGRRVSSTPRCDFLIDSPAIRNARNSPANNIITFSNRQQFASLRAHFALHESRRSNLFSPPTIFLISSGPVLEFDVTHSQRTRKLFLISSFSALFRGFARITDPHSSVFALRLVLRFQKENVVAFGIVEDGPGRAARAALRLVAEYALASQSFHGGGEVGNLEKQDGLIGRRIIFRAFAFQAEESVTGGELCVVAGDFVGEREAENIAVKFFRTSKLVKIQLDAHHAWLRSFGHGPAPNAILRRYETM